MKNYRHISEKPAVALSDWKRAALWFDDWRPVGWADFRYESSSGMSHSLYDKHFQSLVPVDDLHRILPSFYVAEFASVLRQQLEFFPKDDKKRLLDDLLELQTANAESPLLKEAFMLLPKEVIIYLASSDDPVNEHIRMATGIHSGQFDVLGHQAEPNEDGDSSVNVSLSNLSLVDPDQLSWEQISAVREDEEALKQLRQLRRYVVHDMSGEPLSYVEETLSQAMDEHQQAAKKWGLARSPSELEIDCDASMVVGLLAALGAATTGNPLAIGIALGSVIPLGQNLVKINRGRKKVLENSRVSYLVRLQEEAEKAPESAPEPPDRIEPTI